MHSNYYKATNQSENDIDRQTPSLVPEVLSYLDAEPWDLIIIVAI